MSFSDTSRSSWLILFLKAPFLEFKPPNYSLLFLQSHPWHCICQLFAKSKPPLDPQYKFTKWEESFWTLQSNHPSYFPSPLSTQVHRFPAEPYIHRFWEIYPMTLYTGGTSMGVSFMLFLLLPSCPQQFIHHLSTPFLAWYQLCHNIVVIPLQNHTPQSSSIYWVLLPLRTTPRVTLSRSPTRHPCQYSGFSLDRISLLPFTISKWDSFL